MRRPQSTGSPPGRGREDRPRLPVQERVTGPAPGCHPKRASFQGWSLAGSGNLELGRVATDLTGQRRSLCPSSATTIRFRANTCFLLGAWSLGLCQVGGAHVTSPQYTPWHRAYTEPPPQPTLLPCCHNSLHVQGGILKLPLDSAPLASSLC